MYDYNDILERLYENLSSKEEHKNIFRDSAYASLLESFAQELEFYYTSSGYWTRENQWALARNRSSLLSQSPAHGYKAPRKVGAKGFIKFGVSKDFNITPTNTINIPKYTQFSNGSGTNYVADNSYQMTTADTSIDVGVVQGIYRSEIFTASGEEFETFTINNSSIENTFIEVYVNDVFYERVDTLFDSSAEDYNYEVNNLVDFTGVKVRFGNGTFGRRLSSADTVLFQFIETLGKKGNTYSSGVVDEVESVIYDINSDIVEDVFCTNDSAIIGGVNEASLEDIRLQSPRIFQTGDRAVSKTDYISILQSLTYIKKANVWGAYEYNIDEGIDVWSYVAPEENVVHLALITEGESNASDSQKTQILEDINPNKSPTDLVRFETVDFVNMMFNVDAYVTNTSYSLPDVKANIETALSQEYSLDKIEFEQNLYESDYKRFIDAIDGVRYHDTTVKLLKIAEFESAYTFSTQLPVYPVRPLEIKLYIKLKTEEKDSYILFGTGDVDGNLLAENGYAVSGGFNVETGEGAVSITSGLTEVYSDYDVRIEYQSENRNLLLNNRKDIFRYKEANITIQYFRS